MPSQPTTTEPLAPDALIPPFPRGGTASAILASALPMAASALWDRPVIYLNHEVPGLATDPHGCVLDVVVATHDALGVYLLQGDRQALLPWANVAAILLDRPLPQR